MSGPRTVVVTGGTDGLGLAMVRALVARGDRVFAVARNPRGLATTAPGAVFLALDVGHPDAHEVLDAKLRTHGVAAIDLLVHNAADNWFCALDAMAPDRSRAMLDTNLRAPIALTHALLPRLVASRGKLVFVGSISAFLPAARYADYAASKAALDGLACGLSRELAGRVEVRIVHPGPIGTRLHERAGLAGVDVSRLPSPASVAAQVLRRIEARGWRSFTTPMLAAKLAAARRLPSLVDRLALRRERQRASEDDRSDGLRPASSQARVALVTGAASGLGAALVAGLRARGYRVVGVDASFAAEQGTDHDARVCDIVDSASLTRLAARIDLPLDLVVHCAHASADGPFEGRPLADLDRVYRTNLLAPIGLTEHLLVGRRLAPGATIVFVTRSGRHDDAAGSTVARAMARGLASYARSARVALTARHLRVLAVASVGSGPESGASSELGNQADALVRAIERDSGQRLHGARAARAGEARAAPSASS